MEEIITQMRKSEKRERELYIIMRLIIINFITQQISNLVNFDKDDNLDIFFLEFVKRAKWHHLLKRCK